MAGEGGENGEEGSASPESLTWSRETPVLKLLKLPQIAQKEACLSAASLHDIYFQAHNINK